MVHAEGVQELVRDDRPRVGIGGEEVLHPAAPADRRGAEGGRAVADDADVVRQAAGVGRGPAGEPDAGVGLDVADGVGDPARVRHPAVDLVGDLPVGPEERRVAGQPDTGLVDVEPALALGGPGERDGHPQRAPLRDLLRLGGDGVRGAHVDAAVVDGPPVDDRVRDRVLEQARPGQVAERGDVAARHVVDVSELLVVLGGHADHLRFAVRFTRSATTRPAPGPPRVRSPASHWC